MQPTISNEGNEELLYPDAALLPFRFAADGGRVRDRDREIQFNG